MLFNSLHFALFLPLVVIAYYALPHRARWAFLLGASYYFYASWRVEYLLLIIFSTLVDYGCGLRMARVSTKEARRKYLILSVVTNLGLLFSFKYADFAGSSLNALFESFNVLANVPAFNLLLPVGISFYTFQSMSYTIELYRGRIEPERHLGYFALYVAFFPQLVAGPIERPAHLLPQLRRQHALDYEAISSGLRLILWGYFLKLVVADRLAIYVDAVYANQSVHTGTTLALATFFFAFQIYGDFAVATPRLPSEPRGSWVSSSCRTLTAPTLRRRSRTSGGGGIFRCRPGSETTSTSRWGAVGDRKVGRT